MMATTSPERNSPNSVFTISSTSVIANAGLFCAEISSMSFSMLSKVIDDRDGADFTALFATTAHALESRERVDNRLALNSPGVGSDDHREAVADIELAN